ncbi:MAG: protein dehydratase [Azospirillaceae bacterium]
MTMQEPQAETGGHAIDRDVVDARRLVRLAVTLDLDPSLVETGTPAPRFWHWALFGSETPTAQIAFDGHPVRGGILPDLADMPYRMFAGCRVAMPAPLIVGEPIELVERLGAPSRKEGRTGLLLFQPVIREFRQAGRLCVEEVQMGVYRRTKIATATPSQPAEPLPMPDWSAEIAVNEVLLFRFSAVVFNAHRIHYDRDYTTGTEGYPGLVVQGPLTVFLMLRALAERVPDLWRRLDTVEWQAHAPHFDTDALVVHGWQDAADGSRHRLKSVTPDGRYGTRLNVRLAT